jgi:gamma-glutamyl hercynylcysteine S-oxide hydrolase
VCRFVAYVGPPVTLQNLVLDPPFGLLRQSYAPRFQRHGAVNADGFGCGWFDQTVRPEPAVYRTDKPIWSDISFRSIAGVISSRAVLAGVRDANTGAAVDEASTPPFTSDGWLFAHNGKLDGFDGQAGVRLWRMLSDRRATGIRGTSDSEVLFAMVLDRMDDGMSPAQALRWVIREGLKISTGRFNFVLHDGWKITATSCGDSLFVLEGAESLPGAVVIASEPFNEDSGWQQVPESSLVEGYCGGVVVTRLEVTA